MGRLLLLSILVPFFGSLLIPLIARKCGAKTGWVALFFPVLSFGLILWHLLAVGTENPTIYSWPWIPSLDIAFSILPDGLSHFYGLLVSGMGILIVYYACSYMDDHAREHGRFYTYLVFFMATMLGTVFSDNLMLLFVFWELTGIASFLLIGFNYEKEESRRGARMALLITGATGLVMLAGIIMIWLYAGTYSLSEMKARGIDFTQMIGGGNLVLILLMIGAFGKSAQFPFYFWLPNAMAAPTPVSAYLHSATMVKLGLFLTARFYPLLHECSGWLPLLTTVGIVTMLTGALLAIFFSDLKQILAYTTVSQLGLLMAFYGLSANTSVVHDFLHITTHTFYKGSLFMLAGIIDHSLGTRNLREIGGCARRLPLVSIAVVIGFLSMAGIPGTMGFISKELFLYEIFELKETPVFFAGILGAFTIAGAMKFIIGAKVIWIIYKGTPSGVAADPQHFHRPSLSFCLPPLLLACASVILGIFPALSEPIWNGLAVGGLHAESFPHLSIWHGINLKLIISLGIFGAGFIIFAFLVGNKYLFTFNLPRFMRLDMAFDRALDRLPYVARKITFFLRSNQPFDYLLIVVSFFVFCAGGALVLSYFRNPGFYISLLQMQPPAVNPLRIFTAVMIITGIVGVLAAKKWTTQLISLSISGFLTSLYYVLYRAPDLAMTQILVETVTLILILLLLARFPHQAQRGESMARPRVMRQSFKVIISVFAGLLVTVLVLVFTAAPVGRPLSEFCQVNALPLAKGSNVVNTIIIDFRGFDTLGEICVLVIAMLGCLGLLMRKKRTTEEYLKGPSGPAGMGDYLNREENS